MRSIMIILSIMLFSNICFAQYKFSFIKERFEGTDFAIEYVGGVAHGIRLANELMKDKVGKKLFCVPEKFDLNHYKYFEIAQEYANSRENDDEASFALTLLLGMVKTFPCK